MNKVDRYVRAIRTSDYGRDAREPIARALELIKGTSGEGAYYNEALELFDKELIFEDETQAQIDELNALLDKRVVELIPVRIEKPSFMTENYYRLVAFKAKDN